MPDNWAFVAAAYALTAVVLGLYWRNLVRKEKELRDPTIAGSDTRHTTATGSTRNVAGTAGAHTERARESSISDRGIAERSRQPSRPAHPRPDPTTRGPLQS
jgi:hypothetical protein